VNTVRLEPGTAKSGEEQTFYLTADLRKLLKMQITSLDELKQHETICPFVFHHNAAQIKASASCGNRHVKRPDIRPRCTRFPADRGPKS